MKRLAWPIVISLILHVVVLSQANWKILHTPISDQQRLTVSFDPLPSAQQRKMDQERNQSPAHAERNRFKDQVVQKHKAEGVAQLPEGIEIPNSVDVFETGNRLDINRLLNQAKEYALKEHRTSEPTLFLHGDYYGTYTGSDNGTFFFNLDRSGHVSGSGQSDTFGVSFLITGSVTSNGLIQMTGKGKAGIAQLAGQLNINTRQISGSWFASSLGRGLFSGQHE